MVFYVLLACVLTGIVFVCVFLIGGLYTRHLLEEARERERHEILLDQYYKLANQQDMKPYVPPRVRSGLTILPHMNKLDRLMKAGKRGTIMWRAGDRQYER